MSPDSSMAAGIDLAKLGIYDVLNLMVRDSGKSWPEIAAQVGWSTSNMLRICNPGENYWPSLPTMALFCIHTGSTLILDWIKAQAEAGGLKLDTEPLDCASLMAGLGTLFERMGKLGQEGGEVVADGRIDPAECRRLTRDLADLLNKGLGLLGNLRALADALSGVKNH